MTDSGPPPGGGKGPPLDDQTKSSVAPAEISSPRLLKSSSSSETVSKERWEKLQNLNELYDQGFITLAEYKERKAQIIDELTGTRGTASLTNKSPRKNTSVPQKVPYKDPPDWKTLKAERAIKHCFDAKTRTWSKQDVVVKLDPTPFARGAFRVAHHIQELATPSELLVAKINFDSEEKEPYFMDVELQAYAKMWAESYNAQKPPKKIDFVQAWIVELVERDQSPLVGVERFIRGEYQKHNNNMGWLSDDERNTPQAFSHFTYEASQQEILICDIQGVNDIYTDPQMHTQDGVGFGRGNLGRLGFQNFLRTHRCNAICKYLNLPLVNAKVRDMGTVPNIKASPAKGSRMRLATLPSPALPASSSTNSSAASSAANSKSNSQQRNYSNSSSRSNSERTALLQKQKGVNSATKLPPPPLPEDDCGCCTIQ